MLELYHSKKNKIFHNINEGYIPLKGNNKKKKIFFVYLVIAIILFLITIFLLNNNYPHHNEAQQSKKRVRTQYSREEALKRGRNYLNICLEGLLINNQSIIKYNEIKISVIIPLYNNEKMIKSVIRSIQNQNMKEIEIIIINDFSKDNSSKVVEEIQKEDPRIKLINNKKNLGILHSRAIGVLEAKGKYILNLDHDDLFFDEDVFETVYYEAEEGNFDIISFIDIQGNNYYCSIKRMKDGWCSYHPDNITVYQPELTYYPIFKDEKFAYIDIRIWGKLIRTEIHKKALNLLGKERYSVYNVINEDIIWLFSICSLAQSYKYIRKYGIFHKRDKASASLIVTKEHFTHMDIFFSEILFDLSKNENKKYSSFIIANIKRKKYFTLTNESTKLYLIKVIKKILSCRYIEEKYKYQIKQSFKDLGIINEKILEKPLNIQRNEISLEVINSLNKQYIIEIGDKLNVVSKYFNNSFTIYIYKNISIFEEISGEAPIINFGECYNKVKKHYNLLDFPIITIIRNKTNNNPFGKDENRYVFSFPESGEIINTTNVCDENDKIIIIEDIKNLMNDLDHQKEKYINGLARQGINIFNLSDKFYNDICYNYESPYNKDIPLRERVSFFVKNLTICDKGCENKGVDFQKMNVKCECIFNNILINKNNDKISERNLSEIMDNISFLNIEVLKCFSKIVNKSNFHKIIGGYLTLCLLIIQTICALKFWFIDLDFINKHISFLLDSFLLYKEKNIDFPPKRKKNKKNKGMMKFIGALKENYSLSYAQTRKKNIFNINENSKLIKNKKKENPINENPFSDYYLNIIKNYIDDSSNDNDSNTLNKEKIKFCDFFSEKYKNIHLTFNIFCDNEAIKPRTIKIILFISTIELYLVINGLFYNEKYLSKLLYSNKSENFFSFIPRRIIYFIYIFVINFIYGYLMKYFYINEDKLKCIFAKFYKDNLKIKNKLLLIAKEIKIKFILSIIFSISFSSFSFIYISCFNIAYPYIRKEWIKSSIFIFIVMELIYFPIIVFWYYIRFLAIKISG